MNCVPYEAEIRSSLLLHLQDTGATAAALQAIQAWQTTHGVRHVSAPGAQAVIGAAADGGAGAKGSSAGAAAEVARSSPLAVAAPPPAPAAPPAQQSSPMGEDDAEDEWEET